MARKSKKKTEAEITEAEVIETSESVAEDVIEDITENKGDQSDDPDTISEDIIETVDEEFQLEPEPIATPVEPQPNSSGGFLPMMLGGVVAAGIGFGFAEYVWPGQQDTAIVALNQKLSAQAELIKQLETKIADTNAVDARLSATEETVKTEIGALSTRMDGVAENVKSLTTQVTDLEMRPLSEGVSDKVVAAYEAELKSVQDTIAQQRAELEDMAKSAAEKDRTAKIRGALSEMNNAMSDGTGFAGAVSMLTSVGVTVPDALSNVAANGVSTVQALTNGFSEPARVALAASRDADESNNKSFTSFLQTQLGARSLEPKEGDDPDAVLSRAEAALKQGKIADALSQIEALPDAGKSALSSWISDAQTRVSAVSVLSDLSSELTQ